MLTIGIFDEFMNSNTYIEYYRTCTIAIHDCEPNPAFIVSFLYRFLSSSLLRLGSRGSSVVVLDRSAQRCDDSTITFVFVHAKTKKKKSKE
mmetsp:Transcript_7941/g.23458  ORF Transcript_7941/g.23458 Transcript_7941/m.23458 type:complete len:91 (-) Transcript_7941:75-347(-)